MNAELKTKITSLSDRELVQMLEADPKDYTPEAITLAQQEAASRGGRKALTERVTRERFTERMRSLTDEDLLEILDREANQASTETRTGAEAEAEARGGVAALRRRIMISQALRVGSLDGISTDAEQAVAELVATATQKRQAGCVIDALSPEERRAIGLFTAAFHTGISQGKSKETLIADFVRFGLSPDLASRLTELAQTERPEAEKRIRKQVRYARHEAVFAIFLAGGIVGPVALLRAASAKRTITETGLCADLLPHLSATRKIAWTATVVWILLVYFTITR